MVGSGELDLENQQTVPPIAIDRGSGLLISFWNRIRSLCQFPTRPSADDESEVSFRVPKFIRRNLF